MEVPAHSGRPRGFDRDQALERAMELFWRHGYEGVSIADLTHTIGISPPSLYAAFGSKAALYREALGLYQRRPTAMSKVLAGRGPIKKLIAKLLRTAVHAVTDPEYPSGCMVSSGMFACAAENRPEAEVTAALRRSFITTIAARLQRAQAEKELPPRASPDALARYLAAVLQGISMQARDGATEGELLAIVQQVLSAWPQDKIS